MAEPKKWLLKVLQVRHAGEDFAWIHLAAPPGWDHRPGQFLHVRSCVDDHQGAAQVVDYRDDGPWPRAAGEELLQTTPLARRPVSISCVGQRPDGQRELVLLVKMVGPGSRRLGALEPGATLDALGPLGNGFDLDTPKRRAFLVGGGCGIAPLVGVARQLAAAGKEVVLFYGCNRAAHIPLALPPTATPTGDRAVAIADVPELAPAKLVIATEDGSVGFRGMVTDAILAYVAAMDRAAGRHGWPDIGLYACGPDPMAVAVAAMAEINGLSCQVSLENYMGCAIGVCLSCAVKIRAANAQGWTYKMVCKDGPIFEAAQVIFENKWEGCKR